MVNKLTKKEIKERAKDKEESKRVFKLRTPVTCDCKRKKSHEKVRAKYGMCCCDAYSFSYAGGMILANGLFQYIADAKGAIVRDDWKVIEEHAKAIKAYAQADSWDALCDDMNRRCEYERKEYAWKEAMHWLTQHWNSLWW